MNSYKLLLEYLFSICEKLVSYQTILKIITRGTNFLSLLLIHVHDVTTALTDRL